MPAWKGQGPDGVKGYWIKIFIAQLVHCRTENQLNLCLQENRVE